MNGQGVSMVNVSLKVYWSRERYSVVVLLTLPRFWHDA